MTQATTWMNFKISMSSERSQTKTKQNTLLDDSASKLYGQWLSILGWGGGQEGRITKGHKETFGVDDMFILMKAVTVSQVYPCQN